MVIPSREGRDEGGSYGLVVQGRMKSRYFPNGGEYRRKRRNGLQRKGRKWQCG
jgi:hypothetical protein